MSKTTRRLLWWVLRLAGVALLAGLAVAVFGDLSRFTGRVEAALGEAMGTEVTVGGPMRVLPRLPLTVQLEDLRIANPEWAHDAALASIDELRVVPSLGALLSGTVAVETLVIEGLELSLERDVSGTLSWSLPGGAGNRGGVPPSTVRVAEAVLSYRDHARGDVTRLYLETLRATGGREQAEIELAGRLADQAFNAQLRADGWARWLDDAGPWGFEAELGSQRWRVAAAGERRSAGDWHAELIATTEAAGVIGELFNVALPAIGPLESSASLSLSGDTLRVEDLRLAADSTTVVGALDIEFAHPRPRVEARLEADQLSFGGESGSDGTAQAPWLQRRLPLALPLELDVDLSATLELGRLQYHALVFDDLSAKLRLANGSAELDARGSGLGGTVEATAVIEEAQTPKVVVTARASGVNLAGHELGEALRLRADEAGMSAELASRGLRLRELLVNLRGTAVLENLRVDVSDAGGAAQEFTVEQLSVELGGPDADQLRASGRYRSLPVSVQLSADRLLPKLFEDEALGLQLAAGIGEASTQAAGTLSGMFSEPAFDGELEWRIDDLGELAPLLGEETQTLVGSRGTARFRGDKRQWRLDDVQARIGATSLSGTLAGIREGESRALTGSISVPELHWSELAPLSAAFGTGEPGSPASRDLAVSVSIAVDRFAELAALTDLDTRLEFVKGVVRLAPVSGRWSGESFAGEVEIALAPSPALSAKLESDRVMLGPLSGLLGWADALDGQVGPTVLEIQTAGEPARWLAELQGALTLSQGEVDITAPRFSARVSNLSATLESAADRTLKGRLHGEIKGEAFAIELRVDSLAALQAGEPVEVHGTLESPLLELSFAGTAGRPLVPDALELTFSASGPNLAALPLERALPGALGGEFALRGSVAYVAPLLTISGLQAQLAESDLSGRLELPITAEGAFNGELHSREIHIPDLLEASSTDDHDSEVRLIPALPLQAAAPPGLSGRVDWRIDKLWLAASAFKDVQLAVELANGASELHYRGVTERTDGGYTLAFKIDPSASPPARLEASGRSFDFGWLLPDTGTGKPWWPADFDVRLTGPASDLRAFLGGADGEVHFIAGKTEGAEFERWDLTLVSMMLPSLSEPPRDQLSCMVVNFEVQEGVASSDGLVAETQSLLIAGGGSVDLGTERLGLLLTAKPRDTTLTGVSVPLKVEGRLTKPEFAPASNELVLKAGTLLLGVANPIALVGSYVFSKVNDGNRCQSALENARERYGVESSVEIDEGKGVVPRGLFDFLKSGRDSEQPAGGAVVEERD